METAVHPFLMVQGAAEQAMTFYVGLIPNSEILELERYGAAGPGAEGSVMKATMSLGSQIVMVTDSAVAHGFSFTPAFSLFADCSSQADLQRIYAALAA
ncbi:MAG: VOC family protein, partial [Acetobacteraceae bacterium]